MTEDPTAPVEKTFRMGLSEAAYAQPYQCLTETSGLPDLSTTRELTKILIEQYANQEQSLKKWRKRQQFRLHWTDTETKPPKPRQSQPLRFDWLVEHIIKHRGLEHTLLGLPRPERSKENWMDADLTLFGHYAPCNQEPDTFKIALPLALGRSFPVAPAIDREGFATSSPQLHLQRALLTARNRVLQESPALVPQILDRQRGEQAQFMIGWTPPLAALMEFATLYVTIVDITLMQAYYAAFYNSAGTGLKFNKEKIGAATGRTMEDKLRWVQLLSGERLDARDEVVVFKQMKAVRNHLTHFDPPCLAVSIDDVARWLSTVPALAWLLIKIRRCLRIPISGPLVKMAMLPPVAAVPRDPTHERHPLREDAGYASSTWKGQHPHRGGDLLRVPERLAAQYQAMAARASQLLGRPCSPGEIVAAALATRASELNGLDDVKFKKEVEHLLSKMKRGE